MYPQACGGPRRLQERDSTLCLGGSAHLRLRSEHLIWRQMKWLIRQVAQENARVYCKAHGCSPQDDVGGGDATGSRRRLHN